MPQRMLKLPRFMMRVIDRTLDTHVTPLAYVLVVHSLIFSGSFVLFTDEDSVQSTVLANLGIPGGIMLWGALMFFALLLLLHGLVTRSVNVVYVGSMVTFAAWLSAAITYFWGDALLQGILAVVMCFQYGYFFIAAGLGRLWDYTPNRP